MKVRDVYKELYRFATYMNISCTQPSQWYDEYAFTPFNDTIYFAATPAQSQASLMAKRNKKPHGITITSTPGDLATDFGKDAYEFVKECAVFTEDFYD